MNEKPQTSRSAHFRGFILRGLGVVLPPLLTISVLIWAWNTTESYVLRPMESMTRTAIVWYQESQFGGGVLETIPAEAVTQGDNSFTYDGVLYVPGPTGRKYLPEKVVDTVDENADYFTADSPALTSASGYWHRYIQVKLLPRKYVLPIFMIVFVTVLYFVGRLFTFSLGRWFVSGFDAAILRIPIVNKVYGSVKQVTDFAFSEREIEFNNVVAVQYPSQGIWSLGFVTGNSILQLADATGEPMLSVLMPTSPMPMTGFTVTVRRCDTIDVDMTVDEAIQFVVSCGVVVPPNQRITRNGNGGEGRPRAKYRDGAVVLPSTSTAESDPSRV
ncbi:DUF502 domain-containing protein [Stieleria sp. JC731]|uniref:DUF502 domain-containing protein n=1 Tax=Pirellulaceae TaxID=2691357 RepID=UPI001E4655BE|nr:DUF502 domain-containing protein [Stieleria sp. JC731]MCC9602583.1 DUF502 domain-containing protein [Stieleria sp. JC731]